MSSNALIDELMKVAAGCAPKGSKLARDPEKARERLVHLIRYAHEHLGKEIKLPSVKETKRTLSQIDTAIDSLIMKLRRLPADEITAFYQLEQRQWGHLRNLPLAIGLQTDQLKSLQSTLKQINTFLDGNKHKNRKHNVHDIVVTCIIFFMDYIGESKISTSPTSCFSEFVRTLLSGLGYSSETTKIIRAEVIKTKAIITKW